MKAVCGYQTPASLRAHQLVMLDMLRELDRICRKHDIPYMLYAGTLLGAVRHEGFIPWDDDLDVIMLRADYQRFLQVASTELDNRYYLQGEYSDHWPMFFSKLRRNGTACIERYIPKDDQTHMGVYIDIFPCDNLSDHYAVGKMQFLASKVVIAKGLDRRGYSTDSRLKRVFMLLCRIIPLGAVRKLVLLQDDEHSFRVHCFLGAASKYEKSVFPRSWLTERVSATFEDGCYPVSRFYDGLLTALYGDYMILPKREELACKQHGEIVDLEHSYTEYAEVQKNLIIHTYTRSIR